MKGGTWHVILLDSRYEAFWVSDAAEVPGTPETYLDGGFLHQFSAQALADDANRIIFCADGIYDAYRHAALRRIVETLR